MLVTRDPTKPPPSVGGAALLRQSAQALNQALVSQDLLAARLAFARLLLAWPGQGQVPTGTPLAELGSALAVGDLGAARTAFATVSKLRLSTSVATTLSPAMAPSSTGGLAGGLLSEQA
jgi:hypothetical protein